MKTVLVTGASQGLGLALIRHLLEKAEDTSVVCVSRTPSAELEELSKRFADRLDFLSADFREPYVAERRVDDFLRTKGSVVSGLVNNAGMYEPCLITGVTEPRIVETMNVNLIAPILLSKLMIRHFVRHGIAGSLVHISSVAAHLGFRATSVYAATKGGLEAFSRSIAGEWGSRGIRSNVVSVGLLDVGMSRVVPGPLRRRLTEEAPLGDETQVDSVVRTIEFLLSDGAGSVTAQNLHVNAGIYPT